MPWQPAPHLHASVAVLGGQDEAGQVGGQVQAAEVPHQVPEDDGVLAEELVSVDDLQGATEGQDAQQACAEGSEVRGPHLISFILQQGLQLLPQHQRAKVGHRHRPGVGPRGPHAALGREATVSVR